MNSNGLNAMPALSKFLVLLALILSASHENAFTSLSWVAGNQVRINHLTQLQQQMSNPMSETSCEYTCKPTNDQMVNDQTTTQRLEWDAELLNILSPKRVNGVTHDQDKIKVTLIGLGQDAGKTVQTEGLDRRLVTPTRRQRPQVFLRGGHDRFGD